MTEKNSYILSRYLNFLKKQEVLGEPFYDKVGQFKKFYLPISKIIYEFFNKKKSTIIIGISGGQGSGKSTITNILKLILKKKYSLTVSNFSIDDFYKTRKIRQKMSKNIHPLFMTRGVPGTHDIKLVINCLKSLKKRSFKKISIPRFDKASDDRLIKKKWTTIKKKPDVVIFEGWCVSARPQSDKKLKNPINSLEKDFDKDLFWRRTVNLELKNNYKKAFKLIDKKIFLKVPNFSYVFKWRKLQERKLKFKSSGKNIMSNTQVKKFIMFYERITKQMIKDLKHNDIVISLDKNHRLYKIALN